MLLPDVGLKPVTGSQLYVVAPEAVSKVDAPLQIVRSPLPFTVGKGVTISPIVVVLLHPEAVPVRV